MSEESTYLFRTKFNLSFCLSFTRLFIKIISCRVCVFRNLYTFSLECLKLAIPFCVYNLRNYSIVP